MKIGILTFHCAHNYGAVLQCYALQEYLKSLGHEVYIIDYRPNYLKYGLFTWYNWIALNPIKCIRKITFQVSTFPIQYRRFSSFTKFIKNRFNIKKLNLSVPQNDIECFIFGSDQIWRKNQNSFDPIYFGEFKAAQGHKLISYAASMGLNSLSKTESSQIQNWLNNFSKITVREISLKELLTPLTSLPIDLVADPTFLLNSHEWDKVAIKPNINRPYILIYQVIPSQETYKLAYQSSKDLGNIAIIEIASKIQKNHTSHHMIYDASPEEFLGWIKNARFIITTSFHGTVFSIIFKKAFISIKQNKPSDLRIESILKHMNLQNRFIDSIQTLYSAQYYTPIIADNNSFSQNSKRIIQSYL